MSDKRTSTQIRGRTRKSVSGSVSGSKVAKLIALAADPAAFEGERAVALRKAADLTERAQPSTLRVTEKNIDSLPRTRNREPHLSRDRDRGIGPARYGGGRAEAGRSITSATVASAGTPLARATPSRSRPRRSKRSACPSRSRRASIRST